MIDKIFDTKLQLHKAIYESIPFGILLAIVGGFLDAYTFIERGGIFANAQTGNIVLLGVYAAQGKWGQALIPLPCILAFIIGVIVAEYLKNNSPYLFIIDWKQAVLILEIIVLFGVGFIPSTIPDVVVNVIISFVTSVQVSSFRKLIDSPYATTMTTGNLRKASHAAYTAFMNKDHEEAIKSIRYFIIVFSFVVGGFLGGVTTSIIGIRAIWGAVVVLICATIMFSIGERKSKRELR